MFAGFCYTNFMPEDTNDIQNEIEKLEAEMVKPDFWLTKNRAQEVIKEIAELKGKK
jgi:hypothetical protein